MGGPLFKRNPTFLDQIKEMAQVNNDLEVKSESSTQTVVQEDGYGGGLSVFHLICDVMGLQPLYKE